MSARIVSRAHTGGRFSDRFAARLLLVLGGETSLVQSVVGDLEEEYAAAVETSGPGRARWSYAFNALKSLPYLIADGLRHGDPGARARLMFCLGGPALVLAFIGIALAVRH